MRSAPHGDPSDRNGEPSEEDPPWNWQLYAIVLAALAIIIGVELIVLAVLILR